MKPSRKDILGMSGGELDFLLNQCLVPIMADMRMGNRARNYSVNAVDAADAKTVLRKLGFKCLAGEFNDGFAAAFETSITRETPFNVVGEESEELAIARAAALTIVEKTELFQA